jgi:hypothetical protein
MVDFRPTKGAFFGVALPPRSDSDDEEEEEKAEEE